jgi:mono/diheme cytochrome c family protein
MADADKPPDGVPQRLAAANVLQAAWDRFRSGNAVACPVDEAPLALAVDASAGMYRFVCTGCGTASEWFESGLTGMRIRGYSTDDSPDED